MTEDPFHILIGDPLPSPPVTGLAGGDAAWNRANEVLVYNLTMTLQLALEKLGAPAETLSAQEDGDVEHIHDWLGNLPPCYAAAPDLLKAAQVAHLMLCERFLDGPAAKDVAGTLERAPAKALGTEPANDPTLPPAAGRQE